VKPSRLFILCTIVATRIIHIDLSDPISTFSNIAYVPTLINGVKPDVCDFLIGLVSVLLLVYRQIIQTQGLAIVQSVNVSIVFV
jgi:hypothetical protein